ncbi:P-loop containing nucleoside triphosphate hydrolase protein [Massarina eburnea CBS 473.64]|uniref:P-loop containing nucleoside triphosphate hydrolase protein n=1 Tax=Massarina eburnea CBS 473.64 TaxID=1395130 RepID=A0A6A6RW32_9PLEO|nr:P-loop containing nucleoside triphosphate hydrolase protein [Massarina eburnea CBS 473.64]
MAGAPRSGLRRQPIRSAPSSHTHGGSSSTTVSDEHVNADNDGHKYVTPKTEASRPSANISSLGHDFESTALHNGNDERTSTETIPVHAEALGEHMKEAISIINRLESLGLQRFNIPLPKCVVLGDQSTGKSSVIEAISGITTPRSTDTCTRCPLYIQIGPSANANDGWHADVSLRRSYMYNGNPKTSRATFPGWVANVVPEDRPFASTDSPVELEGIIERAQLATLSPLNDPAEFYSPEALHRDPNTFMRCDFSPNVVCIHISQPGLPALSFYDLPGIIGQAENEDSHFLVKFVKNLVSEYIKDPDSLILVTCSLEVDMENSTASGIARELKATNRCIGVLTKPDRLPAGNSREKLQAILGGNRFALGNGYFVVKNPDQNGINMGLTHRDARAQEERFFTLNEPWSMTTFQAYQHRFGTKNLQATLSIKLCTQIVNKLPEIRQQVQTRLAQVEAELEQLPEPPGFNAIRTISDMIQAFSEHIRKEIEADYPHNEWQNNWEKIHKSLFAAIESMRPSMMTSGSLDTGIYAAGISGKGKSIDDAFVIDDDSDDGSNASMPDSLVTPKKRKVEEAPVTPMRRMQMSAFPTTPSQQAPSRSAGMKPTTEKEEYAKFRKIFKLDEVAQHLRGASKSRLPGQLNPKVVDDLIIATLEYWDLPMDQFFKELKQKLISMIQDVFVQHFQHWKDSALFREAWAIIEDLLNSNFTEQRTTMAVESLNDEREGPYVFNEDVFDQECKKTLEKYRLARYDARLRIYAKEFCAQTGRVWSPQEKQKAMKDEKLCVILHAEPYEKEVAMISHITSYYMIAARRFYDSLSIRVASKLFKRLRSTLRDDLDSGLGIHDGQNGPENAQRLLAEPAHRLEKRRELNRTKDALKDGLKYLNDLQEKYGDDLLPQQEEVPAHVFGASFGPTSTSMSDDMMDIGLMNR